MIVRALCGAAVLLASGQPVLARSADLIDVSANRVEADARANCRQRWADDLSMQVFCIKKSHQGAEIWRRVLVRYPDEPTLNVALAACVRTWTAGGVVDWDMAGFCARKQEDAMIEMRR